MQCLTSCLQPASKVCYCIDLKSGVQCICILTMVPFFPMLLWWAGAVECSHDPQTYWLQSDRIWACVMFALSIIALLSMRWNKWYLGLVVYTWTLFAFTTAKMVHFIMRSYLGYINWHSYDYENSDRITQAFTAEDLAAYMAQGYFTIHDARVSFIEWHLEYSAVVNFGRAILFYYFWYVCWSCYYINRPYSHTFKSKNF